MNFAHAQSAVENLAPWFSIAGDTTAVGGAVAAILSRLWHGGGGGGGGPPHLPRIAVMVGVAGCAASVANFADPAMFALVFISFLLGEFAAASVIDILARPRAGITAGG
jgi:hypothetical protein